MISLTELSLKPSLNSLLIPPHAQQQSTNAACSSNPGTPSGSAPPVVDGAVASVSTQVSWFHYSKLTKKSLKLEKIDCIMSQK